jgi:hypothetical protein
MMFLTLKKNPAKSTAVATVDNQPADGVINRLRSRQNAAQCERDMVSITAALARLNERQLNRIGLSRSTLAFDVDLLAERAEREQKFGNDVLRVVDSTPSRMIAAE